MRRPRILTALGLALAFSAPAGANPIDAFGLGSRAASMGSAGTALEGDSSAGYYNPGALVSVSSLRLDFGFRTAQPMVRLDGQRADLDSSTATLFGLAAPGRVGPLKVAFGLSLSLPTVGLAGVKTRTFEEPKFVAYESRLQRFYGAFNAAVEVLPGLSVGGGLSFLSRTEGGAGIKGNVGVTNPDQSELTSRIDASLVAVRYPQAGIAWAPTDKLRLGLAYRGEFVLRLDTSLRIDGNLQDPGYAPLVKDGFFAVQTHVVEMFQPWQVALGGSYRVTPRLLLAADLTFARWSNAPAPQALTIALDVGLFNPLIHLVPPRLYPNPAYHDVVTPRAGLEYRAYDAGGLAIDLRGGGSYEPTPVPEQRGESNLADGNKLTGTFGLGIEGQQPWGLLAGSAGLDLHAAATWLLPRGNHKDDVSQTGFFVSGVVWQVGATGRLKF